MLLFFKLVDETQMPQSQDFRTTFKQILACIFLSVRFNSKGTFQCETPCSFTNSRDFCLQLIHYHLLLAAYRKKCKSKKKLFCYPEFLNTTMSQQLIKLNFQVTNLTIITKTRCPIGNGRNPPFANCFIIFPKARLPHQIANA